MYRLSSVDRFLFTKEPINLHTKHLHYYLIFDLMMSVKPVFLTTTTYIFHCKFNGTAFSCNNRFLLRLQACSGKALPKT